MPGSWHELATAQGGLVTTAQLRSLGHSERRRGSSSQDRELVRLSRGVYADAAVLVGCDDARRTALLVAAERLRTAVDLVAVGGTAARVHGLPVLGDPPRLELAERKQVRVAHHGRSRLVLEADVVEVYGVPVTGLARTTVDVARRGFAAGVVTADAALRRGLPRAELELAVDLSRRWPGRLVADAVVAFADPRAESPLESLGRARFAEEQLPPCELQVWIEDAAGAFARVDHCWRDRWTVAEADGALKYQAPSDLFEEKRREDRLRDLGFEVVRFTWDDALRRPGEVAARVRRAFRRAEQRHAA